MKSFLSHLIPFAVTVSAVVVGLLVYPKVAAAIAPKASA